MVQMDVQVLVEHVEIIIPVSTVCVNVLDRALRIIVVQMVAGVFVVVLRVKNVRMENV